MRPRPKKLIQSRAAGRKEAIAFSEIITGELPWLNPVDLKAKTKT